MDPSEVEFLGEKQSVTIIPSFTFDQIHLISGSVGPFRAGLPTRVPIWLAVNLKQQQKCRIVGQEWMEVEPLNAAKEQEKTDKFFTKMPSDHYMDEALMLLGVASEDIPQADKIRTVIKVVDLEEARAPVIGEGFGDRSSYEKYRSQMAGNLFPKAVWCFEKRTVNPEAGNKYLNLRFGAKQDIKNLTRSIVRDGKPSVHTKSQLEIFRIDIWDIRMSKLRTSVDAFLKSDTTHAKLDHLTPMEINSVRPLLPHALDQLVRIHTAGHRQRPSQDSQHSQ